MRLADVVARLKLVKLGLSGDANDDTGQFVFRDGRVSAHNGVFGLWANMDIGVETALPGDKFISLISACSGQDVEFANVGDSIRVTSGRTKLTMRKLDITSKAMPSMEGVSVDWRPAWTEALNRAAWSMSDDPQRPDLAGITMSSIDGAMVFYSTIGSGITRCQVNGETEEGLVGSSLIIPSRYMGAIQRLAGGSRMCSAIQFADEFLHTAFGEGDNIVHLYGNFPSAARPDRYEDTIASITEGLNWQPIPEGFKESLARVEAAGGLEANTMITVEDGKMRMHTVEDFGILDDELSFAGETEPVTVRAAVLKRAASASTELAISTNCIGLRKGVEFMYVQATVTDAPTTEAPQETES